MTGLALEVDGWPPEPCSTAEPAPARAGRGNPYAALEPCDTSEPDTRNDHGLEENDDRPRIIPGDHGRPPGRPRDPEPEPRVIHNVVRSL